MVETGKGLKMKNTTQAYGLVSRILHWSMAIAFFAMFGLGFWMVDLGYYDPWAKKAPDIHRSVGIILMAVLIFRLIWKIINIEPSNDHLKKSERILAKITHWAFYGLLFVLFFAGYFISTADGRSIDVFGLFSVKWRIRLPSPAANNIIVSIISFSSIFPANALTVQAKNTINHTRDI